MRPPSRARTAELPPELRQVNLDAAGIDIGSGGHYVAVPPGRDPDGHDVREFGAFTTDLHAIADWLTVCGVTTVAMESTGVYWIPLFDLLAHRDFEVRLVDPRRLKYVPGRKTDVLDCQWLQQLHAFGLLAGAFRPDDAICVLRGYLRQRAMLVEYASHHVQHMQKALEQMNLKLTKVISDICGVTGLAIIRAILAGERDPHLLAQLRQPGCRHDQATIARALEGTWREEHLFALRQAVELFDIYHAKITECDRSIEACLQRFEDTDPGTPPGPRRPHKPHRNEPAFDLRTKLYRMTGVDLTAIDGLDAHLCLKIISEVGLDMTRWPSADHFASWLGLAPGNNVTGGKRRHGRTKPSANRAAAAFRLGANALHNSHSALGGYLRRLKARLGPPKALTATAHKLCRLFYHMLKYRTAYVDTGQDYYNRRYRERLIKNLGRKAKELGYALVPQPQPVAAPA